MHAYIHIYAYTHICTPCSECVAEVYLGVKNNTSVTYTPAHALVPRTPVPKCTQRSLQKNAYIYIYTHTYAYAYICTRTHMRIHDTTQHAEAPLLRLTIYKHICIHIHIHMYIHAYVYIHTYTRIYIHIYMSVHILTYTYIRTHIQHVHVHARKHAWNDGAAATAREAWLDVKKLRTSLPRVPNCPFHEKQRVSAERPPPTAAHHTITTVRHPDKTRSSALVQSQSIRSMAGSGYGPSRWSHEKWLRFCHFGAFFITMIVWPKKLSQTVYNSSPISV